MGIMSFFGGNGVRASVSASESIPGKSKAISSSVVDLTGVSNDGSRLPPTKVSDSHDTQSQGSTEIVRKYSSATLIRDTSGGTSGACSDALITAVSGSSGSSAGGRGSASGIGFVKASDLVREGQPQRGTKSILLAISAPKETATSCSPSPQEIVDLSSCSSLLPSLNNHHGTNHPANEGDVGKQGDVRGQSKEVEIVQGSTVVTAPASAATTASNDGTDARRSFSWGSLCSSSSSGKRNFGGKGHRSDLIVLPLHVVGLQFRDLPPSDQHHDNSTRSTAVEPGTPLILEREPCNSHDENAIKVLLPASLGSRFLGYIPGRIAALLAPIIDAASGTVACVTLKTQEEDSIIGRQTLPAVLEVRPLSGSKREPFAGSLVKVGFVGRALGMGN